MRFVADEFAGHAFCVHIVEAVNASGRQANSVTIFSSDNGAPGKQSYFEARTSARCSLTSLTTLTLQQVALSARCTNKAETQGI